MITLPLNFGSLPLEFWRVNPDSSPFRLDVRLFGELLVALL